MNREDMFLYVIPIIVSFLIISMIVFNQFLTIPLLLLTLSSVLMYSEGAISSKVRYIAILLNLIVITLVIRTLYTYNSNYKVYDVYINGISLSKTNTIETNIPFHISSICLETNTNHPLLILNYNNYSYYVFGFSCSNGVCCRDTNIVVPPNIDYLNILSDSYFKKLDIHYTVPDNYKKYYDDFLIGKNDNSSYYQFLEKTSTIAYEGASQSKYKYILYMYFPFMVILVSILVLVLSLFSFKKL